MKAGRAAGSSCQQRWINDASGGGQSSGSGGRRQCTPTWKMIWWGGVVNNRSGRVGEGVLLRRKPEPRATLYVQNLSASQPGDLFGKERLPILSLPKGGIPLRPSGRVPLRAYHLDLDLPPPLGVLLLSACKS